VSVLCIFVVVVKNKKFNLCICNIKKQQSMPNEKKTGSFFLRETGAARPPNKKFHFNTLSALSFFSTVKWN
jgi:hypothetical protein